VSWSSWVALDAPPVGFLGSPTSVARYHAAKSQICNLYVRGGDSALWQRAYDDGWSNWVRHNDSCVLASEPAAGSLGGNQEYVVARGTDGQVWWKSWWRPGSDGTPADAGGWTSWASLASPPGGFKGAPSVVSRDTRMWADDDWDKLGGGSPRSSVINVYVRGGDDALWQRPFFDFIWHPWERLGGVLTSDPAAGSMHANHEHVFVRGRHGDIWQKWWTPPVMGGGTGWSDWVSLSTPPGVDIEGRPATVSRNLGVCNIYVRDSQNWLWQRAWFDGQWHPWQQHLDGRVLTEPACSSMGWAHEQLFVRGAAAPSSYRGAIHQKWWTGTVP
jgi:hypothetical protein